MRVIPLITALLASLLCSCAGTRVAAPSPNIAAADIVEQYKLGSGDQVRITVFNQPNLSGEFAVDGAGFIALPLLGPVKAGEKTSRELELSIAGDLNRGGYLVNPRIAVQVSQFRPYYILGEVGQPGAYPYSTGLTVRKAVAAARGYTYRANTKRVFIQRSSESDEHLYDLTPATVVLPGDTIRIPERLF